jgi:HPt (histidine-containing phosphotransfer) domain-containing protein
LYRNLLEQFACKQAGVARQIAEALTTGERTQAERLAHTVKGVAGNVGIGGVQTAAAAVERAIREGDDSVTSLLANLEAALGPQVDAILRALGDAAPAAAATEFNAEAAATAVARLKALIEDNDGDAADAVQTVADALAGKVDAQRLGNLRDAIAEFDFDKAGLRLKELAQECHLSVG